VLPEPGVTTGGGGGEAHPLAHAGKLLFGFAVAQTVIEVVVLVDEVVPHPY